MITCGVSSADLPEVESNLVLDDRGTVYGSFL
jgi:hypothetical protein